LDLRTVDILKSPPLLPIEANNMPVDVISYLESIYDSRSGKSTWGTPIEKAAGELLEKGEKQDVILFNNVIQHMQPKDEKELKKTFEQIADLTAPNGVICADIEDFVVQCNRSKNGISVQEKLELFHDVLKNKNFKEIGKNIFEKQ
jgi:hypothetical protein